MGPDYLVFSHVVVPEEEKKKKPGWPPNCLPVLPVPPGRPKGKFSPFANHSSFLLYPVRHWFGPHSLSTSQRLWGGAMAWWWWQLANHDGPRVKWSRFPDSRWSRVRGRNWMKWMVGSVPIATSSLLQTVLSPAGHLLLLYLDPVLRPIAPWVYVHTRWRMARFSGP